MTMKWYHQRYVSHRDWILDNIDLLDLTAQEAIILLLIDFYNEHHLPLSIPALAHKTKTSEETINKTISILCARKYLELQVQKEKIYWKMDGLFETEIAKSPDALDTSLFELFEREFGRTFSPTEIQKISDWQREVGKEMVVYALREASSYGRLKFNYIDRIIRDWQSKNVSVNDLEKG